jgi:hypothetical protein
MPTAAVYDPGLGLFVEPNVLENLRLSFEHRNPVHGIRVGRGTTIQFRRRLVKQGYAEWTHGPRSHSTRNVKLTDIGTIRLGRILGRA